jgi:hypothetical protein
MPTALAGGSWMNLYRLLVGGQWQVVHESPQNRGGGHGVASAGMVRHAPKGGASNPTR